MRICSLVPAILMPCGCTVDRTCQESGVLNDRSDHWDRAMASWPRIIVVDAAACFSHPGPRLVDGVEILHDIVSEGGARLADHPATVRRLSQASLRASQYP
jgi:iron complex transport system substrate-binding protein